MVNTSPWPNNRPLYMVNPWGAKHCRHAPLTSTPPPSEKVDHFYFFTESAPWLGRFFLLSTMSVCVFACLFVHAIAEIPLPEVK